MTTFKERQAAYEKRREEERIKYRMTQDKDLTEQIRALYKDKLDELEGIMNRWLGAYADENGISFEEAKGLISKFDVEKFADKARKMVRDRDFSDEANRQLRKYNLKMRLSRQELLKSEIELALIDLGNSEELMMRANLDGAIKQELEYQSGVLGLSAIHKKNIERATKVIMNSSWNGVTWSDRIWRNNEDLRARVGVGLRTAMMQGENPRSWSSKFVSEIRKEFLSKKGLGNAVFAAERLAITEMGRLQIEVQIGSYQEMGYDKLEVITEPGACKHCIPHDGKVVSVKDAKKGVNIPMFHPFCRCSTAPYFSMVEKEVAIKEYDEEEWALDLDARKEANSLLSRAKKNRADGH